MYTFLNAALLDGPAFGNVSLFLKAPLVSSSTIYTNLEFKQMFCYLSMLTLQETTRMYLDSNKRFQNTRNIRLKLLKTTSKKQMRTQEYIWKHIEYRQTKVYDAWLNDHINNIQEFEFQIKSLKLQCKEYENLCN